MLSCRRALIAALVVVACSDPAAPPSQQGLPPGPSGHGVHVVSGEGITDTALALAPQPLLVRVRGLDGEPLAGVGLLATVLAHDTVPSRLSMAIAPGFSDAGYTSHVETTSDANGYAQFAVRLGGVAGSGAIEIRATSPDAAGLPRDTARYTIRPGRPRRLLLAPRDTTLFVGGTGQPRARLADLSGNLVSDAPAPSFEASSSHLTVSSTGLVTAATIGRSWVRVRAAGIVDSVAISVVPSGMIAARLTATSFGSLSGAAVIAVNLDGSNPQLLVPSGLSGSGDYIPDWDPTGPRIVIDAAPTGQRLHTYTMGGAGQQVMTAPNGLSAEFRPQYSNDGWIYFVGSGGFVLGIHRVRPDGTGFSRVTSTTVRGFETHPGPSPDGTRVVVLSNDFSGCVCTGSFALRILDVTTGISSPLGIDGFWPRWSPNGDLIAFLTNNNALAVVRPDGSGFRVVSAAGRFYDGSIDWSPDGRWVIAHERGTPWLNLIEVETSLTLPLAFTTALREPAWRP